MVVERLLPRLVAIRDAAKGIGWGCYDYLCGVLAERSRARPKMRQRHRADEAMSPRRRPAGHLRLVSGSDGPITSVATGTSALAYTNRHGVAFYLHQRIITDLATIDVTPDGLVLREVAPGISAREVQELTGPTLKVGSDLKTVSM